MKLSQDTTPDGVSTTASQVGQWALALRQLHARIASRFARAEPRQRVLRYLQGLRSLVERKNGWQLAEQAREATPYGMQRLLSSAVWDADLVRDDLRSHVLEQLGTHEAIVAIDETSFPKRGHKSAGVQVQYCGTTGQVENCQVGVFLSYVTAKGHSLIDRELYLPFDWTADPKRCQEAGIPESARFQTKPELAVQMLAEGERRRVEALLLAEQDWQRLAMSEGTKGPRLFDWACVPILHRWEDDGRHWLLIRRSISDPAEKVYYCVFAPKATTLHEMVKAIGARWRIEEDFENTKDMGLDQYEVRSWTAWYRHVTLVMLAYAFLVGICAQVRTPPCESAPQAPRPLLPPTVAEVRHLLGHLIWPPPSSAKLLLAWSWWRRCHRSGASYFHTKRRLKAG